MLRRGLIVCVVLLLSLLLSSCMFGKVKTELSTEDIRLQAKIDKLSCTFAALIVQNRSTEHLTIYTGGWHKLGKVGSNKAKAFCLDRSHLREERNLYVGVRRTPHSPLVTGGPIRVLRGDIWKVMVEDRMRGTEDTLGFLLLHDVHLRFDDENESENTF